MKSFSLFFLSYIFFCFQVLVQAQTDSVYVKKDTMGSKEVVEYITHAQTEPRFKGGDENMFVAYVVSYVLNNTPQLKDSVITGKVLVQYTVEKDGSISKTMIIPGRGMNPIVDQAVVDAVNKSQWEPGTVIGNIVPVRRVSRIIFK